MVPGDWQNETGGSDGPEAPGSNPAPAKLDRRAEALRSNLKRRKAQSRGRAEAQPEGAVPRPDQAG
jgi:hypothetical protein